ISDELPSRIWTVQDYHRAREFYQKRNLIFNPALEAGSPAALHLIAQAQLRATGPDNGFKDFFISYNNKDKQKAEWIAWKLEEAGYLVTIQAWDFRPGANFVLEMQKAAEKTTKTIVVLSQNYLDAEYTQPEWAAAFANDPCGTSRKLVPIRVEECAPTGLLKSIIYVNLVGLSEEQARVEILDAFAERAKPTTAPH